MTHLHLAEPEVRDCPSLTRTIEKTLTPEVFWRVFYPRLQYGQAETHLAYLAQHPEYARVALTYNLRTGALVEIDHAKRSTER